MVRVETLFPESIQAFRSYEHRILFALESDQLSFSLVLDIEIPSSSRSRSANVSSGFVHYGVIILDMPYLSLFQNIPRIGILDLSHSASDCFFAFILLWAKFNR